MFELPLGLERNGVLHIVSLLFCIISDVIHEKNVQFIVLFNLKKMCWCDRQIVVMYRNGL